MTGGHSLTVQQWASKRQPYLDNLKVILIAAIIVIHGVLGYAGSDELWSYADVQEVTLSPVTETVLFVLAGPFALFMIPVLFLVAGLLTPRSLDRKGPGHFARDRLLRLGVPFALFTFLLWPLLMYALYHPLGEAPGTYWGEFLDANGNLDTGPMWFIGVLLIFSLAYAAGVQARRHRPARRTLGELTGRHLLVLAVVVATGTFLVRLVFPFGSESFTDLNLWEWPACLALFMLGITASRQGWLTAVPDRLRTQCRTTTLVAAVLTAALVASAEVTGIVGDDLWGGWHWPALAFSAVESTLTVFGSVWLFGVAQRRLNRQVRLGPALSRSAYAAFLVQGMFLIGLAVALRAIPVPAEVKAMIVSCGGVAGSFGFGWLLVSRVPWLTRIL